MMNIYTINKPFGELSDELAAGLFLHWIKGGKLQSLRLGHGVKRLKLWAYATHPQWAATTTYRAVRRTIPATIPWNIVAPSYNWYAEDASGFGYIYKDKPYTQDGEWHTTNPPCVLMSGFLNYSPSRGLSWEDSIVQRPDMAPS